MMRRLFILIPLTLVTTSLWSSAVMDRVPEAVMEAEEELREDIQDAFEDFEKEVDKAIKKAERKGDVGEAARLLKAKEAVLEKMGHQQCVQAAADAQAEDFEVTEKWLKETFHATKVDVSRRGKVTLLYAFRSPAEARDFTLSNPDCSFEDKMMKIGPSVRVEHNAKWDGDIDVKVELAHANRKGAYLSVGPHHITGKSYNAWLIRMGSAEAKFAKDYYNSGNINEFRELVFKIEGNRCVVKYGQLEHNPVTLAVAAGPLRKGRITLHGADGGAAVKSLIITGTLNTDAYIGKK